MRSNYSNKSLNTVVLVLAVLLLGASVAAAQQQINLTAAPTSLTLPDGSIVPMWGYSCGAVVMGSTATCAKSNPAATGWSPVVITVPTGQGLTINLTNNLTFTPPTSGASANNIPTSIVIIGQVGGGLGTSATYVPSPAHNAQDVTWPIANTSAQNNPPPQGQRVQSFATEVTAVPAGTLTTGGALVSTALTWNALKPGTYLLESGTHPSIQVPMGLIGTLLVTTAPVTGTAGTAYTGVSYDADVPLEFSEMDPVQNNAVNTAVNSTGFSETAVWTRPANGGVTTITVSNGGSGYTSAPNVTLVGGGGYGGAATATVTAGAVTAITVSSSGVYQTPPSVVIDPPAIGTRATATSTLSSITGGPCGGGASACYPPAVNYTPLYYLINGVAFSKSSAQASVFPTPSAMIPSPSATGTPSGLLLVRLVNAGLRMHVPSLVGTQTGAAVAPATVPPTGFTIIAEDGNLSPGIPKVQSDVFMAAGKTFDVMINGPTGGSAIPVFDRELSLSGNSSERDAGMLAYISVNGSGIPAGAGGIGAATAVADNYPSLVAGLTFTVSDVSKGVIANDVNVYGVQLDPTYTTGPANGTVTLNRNGTFTYVPSATATNPLSDSFGYCANGAAGGTSGLCTTVTLGAATIEGAGGITMGNITYTATTASYLKIASPGVLSVDKDGAGYPLKVATSTVTPSPGLTVVVDPNGGFKASVSAPGSYSFTYQAQNSQGTLSGTGNLGTVILIFPQPSNVVVTVKDPTTGQPITDYRWVIEEDKTFYVNPNNTTTTGKGTNCNSNSANCIVPPTFGVNFHTSHMEYVAQGCFGPASGSLACESGQTVLNPATGQHVPAVCDLASGACDLTATQETPVNPGQTVLDPGPSTAPYPKRYYISVLPGDGATPFITGNASGGHGMGGAPITWNAATSSWNPVTVVVEPSPYPTGRLSVQVFEDDFPLNGEQDAGGGVDVIATNEPGLGGFNVVLWDDMGGSGDVTGQMTYDMFNQPLSNSLAGTIDPATGLDACPISANPLVDRNGNTDPTATGITGMIVTCPTYEADGVTFSPLAGQAIVANLMPGRFSVQAYPGADRIARGEEWLQTNTLDGQHPHDSFIRIGEPSYFQEYGPAGFHVSIGFANPKIINNRYAGVCGGTDLNLQGHNCTNTVTGKVTAERMSRTPDQRLYSSGSRDAFYWTQCFVSLGDPDGEDFMLTKCDANGNFTFSNVPAGSWRLSIFDQWNDQLMDGLSTPVDTTKGSVSMGDIPVQQWQANVYTRTFVDDSRDGIYQTNELGIPFLNTTVRYRDGSLANNLLTDFSGVANFNETFPLFNWYVVETDTTRYKTTGIHTVYDAGGPADKSASCGQTGVAPCGTSTIGAFLANTVEQNPLPPSLSVPGAVYCSTTQTADCNGASIAGGPVPSNGGATGAVLSTGRIDPPWVAAEGWQGFSGQNSFIEFGKTPYTPGENGGIHGHVIYASTRPFDDPQMLVQTQWEPLVPHVTINLYKEGFAADKVTPTLTLVDTTKTSSWDDWAQGFRSDHIPNMNCPGQSTSDLFYYSLYNQSNYLDLYNSYYSGTTTTPLPNNSQFKCYDGMHNWNQVQPAPYDGMYSFPSVTGLDPSTGKPTGTNCTACTKNPDSTDPYRFGTPMLPAGKYVVEMVLPPGYELVKEEDKNILIGDNFIAPVTQEFGGLGNIFIIPDQASVAAAYDPTGSAYNANNAQNPTQNLGTTPSSNFVPAFLEPTWPCVGELRIVPDYMSIFPQSYEVSPFAGASRHLCDRKEVTLGDQMGATAKFYIYTSTHIASKFTGVITDDFTSEFDPFAPTFGEKFSPPNMPVSLKDWAGYEIARVYSDQWGDYNGLTYSTWEVNPPNPTGYSPTMLVQCMNDKGPIPGPNGTMMIDPLFNPLYSQFCYELPYMPGQTDYLDTPVVPTAAFVGAGYNNPDCSYPALTPAIASVVSSDIAGPWALSAGGIVSTINITNGGSGYTSAPTVTLAGGGGTGATATAVISGFVSSLSLNHHGTGYTSAPTVGFTGGGGTGATATAALGFPVASVAVNNAGAHYAGRPSATFSAPGNGGTTATGNTFLSVSSVVLSNGGHSYTSAPTVTLTGGGGSGATATATINGSGVVTGVTITNGGTNYTGRPTVTFSGGGGTGAAAANTATTGVFLQLSRVGVTNAGSGYTTAPSVTISSPVGGTTATASATLSAAGGVYVLILTSDGSGYTSAPSVSFSGGGGSGATATATTNESVTAVNVTNGGSGYTGAPTVNFSGGGGSGAAATAVVPAGSTLTVTALGDQMVPNYGYSGPSATAAPYNQKTLTRHYGFGSTPGTVTVGGVTVPPNTVTWGDTTISFPVPSGVPACTVQQQAQYGGSPAQCGQLVITASNGQQSIDTVTVTIGGKKPTVVAGTIQAAIDAAAPGDMIIVPAGVHAELLLMWKPVRLQGVGAASSVIDASPHPAGKLDPWRRSVNCLFGLALNGQPGTGTSGSNPFDSTGTYTCPTSLSGATGPDGNVWNYFSGGPNFPSMVVDRIPLEGILGWDATVNGNLAEQLQEPSIMGAYEGAAITVLGKGVNIPAGSTDVFGSGAEAGFPTGTTLLTGNVNPAGIYNTGDANSICHTGNRNATNPYPGNYQCNPSSIDGLGITDSSQGGGGIYVHAWAHNLQIANNRIYNNAGTLSGGMTIGQGEFPEAYLNGTTLDTDPGSCLGGNGYPPNTQLPYCFNLQVNMHNNSITNNSSTGDELFTGTPAGAGGVSICTGDDYYKFNYNWICGNMSTGDGGGVGQLGFDWNGDIEHNSFLFNQSTNPSIQTNGGGLIIMGAAPDGNTLVNGVSVECGSVTDNDCVPGLSDGTGPGLLINANLFEGNGAEAGSGGGIRLQAVNGADVARFNSSPKNWYQVTVSNNIINNNVAGWDGAGVSLEDALAVTLINNTIASNDTTASSGVLFNTIGAPLSSSQSPAPTCISLTGGTASCPQPAGLVSMQNSPQLTSSFTTGPITCPAGNYVPGTSHTNGTCIHISYPALYNNIFWQNRSFQIGIGALGTGNQNQQNVVSLFDANFSGSLGPPVTTQTATGSCADPNTSYWDIGVRNDTGPANHNSGYTLNPLYGVLTSTGSYSTTNLSSNPSFNKQYCNGSRVPPENGGLGYNVPPGIADAVVPNPIFSLTPTATVDEGNNWVNISWGPLSMLNPVDSTSTSNDMLGNYSLMGTSPALNAITCVSVVGGQCVELINASGVTTITVPAQDFFGNTRPDTGTRIDVGAVEVTGH